MKIFKQCIFILYFVLFSGYVFADENVQDGRPCLSGICVGDEISTLAKIKWLPATYERKPISLKLKDAEMSNLLKHFAANSNSAVRVAAPYLWAESFDNNALSKVGKVKGFCEQFSNSNRILFLPDSKFDLTTGKQIVPPALTDSLSMEYILTDLYQMEGFFNSESGHRTKVLVSLALGQDPANQTLRVQSISRSFPNEYTTIQMEEIFKQLNERYKDVKFSKFDVSNSVPTWNFHGRKLTLNAPIQKFSLPTIDHLRKYPGCTKSSKID